MAYVTDTTIVDGSSKSIYGFRSGLRGSPKPKEADTCDLKFTRDNPFDFSIDWRTHYVKVREPRKTKSGRIFYKTVRREVPYPFYQFKSQTRSIREWRLIYNAGIGVLLEAGAHNFELPHVKARLLRLRNLLMRHKKCLPLRYKNPEVQHDCLAMESSIDSFPSVGPARFTFTCGGTEASHTVPNFAWLGYRYRFWEPLGIQYTGPSHIVADTAEQTAFKSQLSSGLISEPQSIVFDSNTVSTVTAMLWPDSGDFEDVGSSPLIDLAEAISDGHYPLGPPPNPAEAHDRILANAISNDTLLNLQSGKDAIDFASNLWLWKALVLEPVVSSAIGLMASVAANDKAIDAYTRKAKEGKWIKGKSLRLFSNAADCNDVETHYSESKTFTSGTYVDGSYDFAHANISVDADIKKAEANAMLVYKLSEFDAAQMNTSGVRLGQFFNRLSSGFDEVLHNIIPLSFVYDWFSSEYTGILNLENKIYMPVQDWKLTMSYNLDMYLTMSETADFQATFYDKYYCSKPWRCVLLNPPVCVIGHYRPVTWTSGNWKFVPTSSPTQILEQQATERLKFYKRTVYNSPVRRTDFSSGIGISCLDTLNPDPLDMGKSVTLGALIWGFIS